MLRTHLVFDTFTPEEFEALPPGVRIDLIKARSRLEGEIRRLHEDMNERSHELWLDWLRELLFAKETLHQTTKE